MCLCDPACDTCSLETIDMYTQTLTIHLFTCLFTNDSSLHWYVGDCTVSINRNAIAAIDRDFLRIQALKNSIRKVSIP